MTEKTFKKKKKDLQDQYVYWAEIRNNATNELHKIIKKTQKLEEKYFEEHSEKQKTNEKDLFKRL